MSRLPNILSLFRIVGGISLLICDVVGTTFWVLYSLCGLSDKADGWLARKLKSETKTGALLDSLADIVFVACCCWKLIPILTFPQWLWMWGIVIVAIKVINQISALVIYKKFVFPHTIANKVTGFLLFLAAPIAFWSIIPIAVVAGVATFAAVQEGHFIRKEYC